MIVTNTHIRRRFMPTAKKSDFITVEKYLNGELISEVKHEYVDGQIYVMAGASKNHERISGNFFAEFRSHLKGSTCESFGADLKIKTPSGSFRYPDCMVVCDDDSENEYYTTLPKIIVEQDVVDVTVYRKSDDWRSTHYFLGDKIHFESIDLALSVEDIYDRVKNEDVIEFLASKNEQ